METSKVTEGDHLTGSVSTSSGSSVTNGMGRVQPEWEGQVKVSVNQFPRGFPWVHLVDSKYITGETNAIIVVRCRRTISPSVVRFCHWEKDMTTRGLCSYGFTGSSSVLSCYRILIYPGNDTGGHFHPWDLWSRRLESLGSQSSWT